MDDARLVVAIADGDDDAFTVLHDRYAPRLLSFCRYLLGSRDEAQDAVQQTFMRVHQALRNGKLPDELRPWLYAIARNRCRTIIAARRSGEVPVDELEGRAALDGLAEEVQRREDLRTLVHDLDQLPEDQRAALVLFELGDLSQRDVAGVLDVPEAKVKALVHQARAHLIAERAARERSCDDVRAELGVARGAALRRGPLRRHLRSCPACRAWQAEVTHQRAAIAAVLPVAALAGSRDSLLGALGIGSTSTAAAATAAGGAAAGGAAAGGAAAGGGGLLTAISAGGAATKAAATIAAIGVIGGGAAGTRAVISSSTAGESTTSTPATTTAAAQTSPAPQGTSLPAALPAAATTHSANSATATKPGQQRHARGRKRAEERRLAAAEHRAAIAKGGAATSAPGQTRKAAKGTTHAAARTQVRKSRPTRVHHTKPATPVEPVTRTTPKPPAAATRPATTRPATTTPPASTTASTTTTTTGTTSPGGSAGDRGKSGK